MKHWLLLLFIGISLATAQAQNEIPADTLPDRTPAMPEGVKDFGGFLLDMDGLMKTAPTLPRFTLEVPNASKDYSFLLRPNNDVIYTQGLSDRFSPAGSMFYTLSPFGLYGFGSATDNLQMGSFRLKNGWRLNTYGEYDKDGNKVYNPSALPWEKNNFKGAFEMKSQDGSFGIRVEVQRGRKTPF